MNLESNKVSVQKSKEAIYEFLTKVENYEGLMPENTDKFELREEAFIFALKGMPDIKLKMQETVPTDKIVLGSGSDKFPFTLTGHITESSENTSEVQLIFDGKFNPMIAMMVKSPLQKFMDALISNIEKI